ncbi:MAG: magnesium transporter [Candidatus Eremiobacteraeota bacterium]|nr:magnesium transporter [Candidatus Eremiobacteraeota bacterium]MBV9263378.1 magnesium transporter [Candidatus Eremiobacteraeota bacterium]
MFTQGFISDLIRRPVTIDDRPIGNVADFLIGTPDDAFPTVDGLIIKTAGGMRFAPMDTVADVDRNGSVVLRIVPKEPAPPESEELYLVADLLDKQIVDVDGRKVVRINDIEVANTGGKLRVVAADVGIAGLLRRLGLRSFGRRWLSRLGTIPRSMIAWNSVAPIRDANPSHVRLSVKQHRLARLHPSELAEIISELSAREAAAVVGQLDDETAADAFEHLDAETQKSLIEDIGTERAADIIEEMDSDDAADLLAELPEEQQSQLLAEMSAYTAGELRELVKYPEDTAGGLMTTDYVWIYPHRTTEATIRKIREIAPVSEFIYYLYVVDGDDHLLGALSLRSLLLALPTAFIDRIMERDLVTVTPLMPAVDVASMIAKYDLLALPVVEEHGRMLGIVTVDDAIDAIMPEEIAKKLPHIRARHQSHPAAT